MKHLQNKVALVTGGAGGIGAAISCRLAAAGASVIITYRSDENRALSLLNTLDGDSHAVLHASLEDSMSLFRVGLFIKEKYGRLDILVNNAGITKVVPHDDLDTLTDEWIDRIFSINFRGSFVMIRVCKELLITSGEGLVVNISSVAAVSGIGSNVAYCASKAAIDSMTRSLGRALAPHIRVVSVSPGWVRGTYAQSVAGAYLDAQINATPLNRLATADDVADAVIALATQLRFNTGCIIPVDGGRLLGKQ